MGKLGKLGKEPLALAGRSEKGRKKDAVAPVLIRCFGRGELKDILVRGGKMCSEIGRLQSPVKRSFLSGKAIERGQHSPLWPDRFVTRSHHGGGRKGESVAWVKKEGSPAT